MKINLVEISSRHSAPELRSWENVEAVEGCGLIRIVAIEHYPYPFSVHFPSKENVVCREVTSWNISVWSTTLTVQELEARAKKAAAEFYAEEAINLHKRAKTFEVWAVCVN